MNLLTDHIAYLLTRHDCVIVPGWGAFIAGRTSAHFDTVSGMIFPPRRELGFNATISNNDGLVATSVSRRENLPYAKALQTVMTEVDSLRHQLENDGELVLPRIGRFIKGAESTPQFEPDPDGIVNAVNAPLMPVRAAEYQTIEPIEKPAEAVVKPFRRPRKARTFVRFAAAAALFLGIGFAATDSSLTPVGTVDLASMTPGASQRVSTIITDDVNAATELFVALPTDGDATKTIDALPAAETQASAPTATPPYCLVVASLNTMKQARKYIAWQGDSRLRIVNSGSRYRVYIASGSTFEQVSAAKTAAIAARYPDAWVCEN